MRIRLGSPMIDIPDWMRCINCKVFARGGVIAHSRTCPEHGLGAPFASAGEHGELGNRPTNIDRLALADALDRYGRFVGRLTQRRPERFDCPSCGARGDGHGLRVVLDGTHILFHCHAGCRADAVLRALRMTWEWVTGEVTP